MMRLPVALPASLVLSMLIPLGGCDDSRTTGTQVEVPEATKAAVADMRSVYKDQKEGLKTDAGARKKK